MQCPNEILLYLPDFAPVRLRFSAGSKVNLLDKTNIPPILAARIFPSPGQQERLFPLRF